MVYLACIHFCIPCCIPFNVYFWCVLVRTHYNEYTKTIRIPQCLCIHKSILSVRFKYTFPIRRLKYTISIQKYTFYRVHTPSFLPFSYTSLSTHNTVVFLNVNVNMYTQGMLEKYTSKGIQVVYKLYTNHQHSGVMCGTDNARVTLLLDFKP